MTIRQLTDLILYIGAVSGALIAVFGVVRIALVKPMERWIAEEIRENIGQPLGQVVEEVTQNSGRSLRDAVDKTSEKVSALQVQVDAFSGRLDRHLVQDHHSHTS